MNATTVYVSVTKAIFYLLFLFAVSPILRYRGAEHE